MTYDRELSESERISILSEIPEDAIPQCITDTIVVGDEKFERKSSLLGGKICDFVVGCYGDRYFEACQREGLKLNVIVISR